MQHDSAPLNHAHWARPIEDIDAEIVQLALVCGMHSLDPITLARLMHNDSLVCDHDNPRAFEKMRQLLMMHYVVTERAIEALGPTEAHALAEEIVARIRARFGHQLDRLELNR